MVGLAWSQEPAQTSYFDEQFVSAQDEGLAGQDRSHAVKEVEDL